MPLKFIVTGHAGHGKDTVCEILRDKYNYTFQSSSAVANREVIFPKLQHKYNYETLQDCYADRVNHRQEWFDLIAEYNCPDLTKLGKAILKDNDIYCGLRNINELVALRRENIVFLVIWIDASRRLPKEATSSMTITPESAHYILDNNGDLEDLSNEVLRLTHFLNQFK